MKKLNQSITETSEKTELLVNLERMMDEVMLWRYKLLRNEGLTRPGLLIMYFVSNRGPLKLKDCSVSLGVSKPTVTRIVDNLEKDGLVIRIKEGDDRRNYYVHLTGMGRKRLESLNSQLEAVFKKATGHLKLEDVRRLNSSLRSIRERLGSISKQSAKSDLDV
ncbi:MAG: MarR family winged helix-turn-helix transcriptional regulator [Thermoplasmata archaeon]